MEYIRIAFPSFLLTTCNCKFMSKTGTALARREAEREAIFLNPKPYEPEGRQKNSIPMPGLSETRTAEDMLRWMLKIPAWP